jgi:streptogramin lyase
MRELSEALRQFDPPTGEERYPCGHTQAEHVTIMGEERSMLFDELVKAYKRFWGMD